MFSPWKTLGFFLYIVLYITVKNVYSEWPEASASSAIYKVLPVLHMVMVIFASSEKVTDKQWDYRKWISAGLVFSAAGDALLVWRDDHFMAGTAMFGIAQLCYVRAFGFKPFGSGPTAATFAVFVAILYFMVIHDLHETISLKASLICYMLLICTMTWRATVSFQRDQNIQHLCQCVGAVVFVISDIMVAYDKFRGSFYRGPFWIMITYYAAQFLIATSAVVN